MFFPLLATRLLVRNVVFTPSRPLFRPALTRQITRTFSVSRVVCARAATSKAKSGAKKTPEKKGTATKKPAKKRVAKKTAAKKKPAAKAKKEKKKAPIRVLPEHKPPKGAASPYILFFCKYKQGAQRHAEESPKEFIVRLAKEGGASWRALSDQEKKPFYDESATAHEEAKKRREEYKKNIDPLIVKEINRRRTAKGKRKLIVKRRHLVTGYILFCTEQRKQLAVPLQSLTANLDLTRDLARRWNALSDLEKASFKEKARAVMAEQKA